jgi:dUTP pyrophosphatase
MGEIITIKSPFYRNNKNWSFLAKKRRINRNMELDYWIRVLAGGTAFFLLLEAVWYYLGIILTKIQKKRGFKKITLKQWEEDAFYKKEYPLIIKYEDIKLPKRATSKSGGYDIFSTVEFTLKPNEEIKIPTGIKCYMLDDEKFEISPRSGLGFNYYLRLANTIGKIDADYIDNEKTEGHIWIKIRNEGTTPLTIKKGDAVVQGSFEKYLLMDGDDFTGTKRIGGLGSTG